MRRETIFSLVAALATFGVTAGSARAATTCDATWNGGSGDWMNAANWTPATVPGPGANVCIPSGAPVLEDTGPNSPSLGSLTLSGTASLTVHIHQVLVVTGTTTIGSGASLTLNGTYYGANAGNASLGGGAVVNNGTLTMEGSGYRATLYGNVTNNGILNVPFGNVSIGQGDNGGPGSFTNMGTITIAAPTMQYPNDPAGITVIGAPFTDASGAITNQGTFDVGGANGTVAAFTQGNGAISGNPINLHADTSLAWTGTGPAAFSLAPGLPTTPMSGNLASGQELTVPIGGGVGETGSFTNAGTIVLNGSYPGCCGGAASITIASGALTNTGTITATGPGYPTELIGSVINQGTILAAPGIALETTTGTFVNGAAGKLVPQISSSATGAFTFDDGVSFTAGGTLAPALEGGFVPTTNQSFRVIAGKSLSGAFAAVTAPWTASSSRSGEIDAVYGPGTTTTTTTPTTTSAPVAPSVTTITGTGATLYCPVGHSCLPASLIATVTERVRVHHRYVKRAVVIGSGAESVATGRQVTIKLRLNAKGRFLLSHRHALHANVSVVVAGKVIRRAAVVLRAPKPGHHRKR